MAYTFLSSLIILPLALIFTSIFKKKEITTEGFFGLSVNLDKEATLTPELLKELDAKHILVRFPMSDMKNILDYKDFIQSLNANSILLNIIQDPLTLKDKDTLHKDFSLIFETFFPYVQIFQVGSTINRSKWGFFSVNQYLHFFQVAYTIKKENYPSLKLLGPSVIDFEYHYVAHALFNFFSLKFDAISALLYVDRRGAPENTQMGLDLNSKIHLLYSMASMSPKTSNELYITETNWPLSNTAPYAPTSDKECIDEDLYASYMVRYYLLSLCSNMLKAVYWHQLIAPGYGLIDNRGTMFIKRPAFYAFKTMLSQLQNAQIISFNQHKFFYEIIAEEKSEMLQIFWCNDTEYELRLDKELKVISRDGKSSIEKVLHLSHSPIYCKEIL